MADIVTSRVFVDGEKGITAAKLNDIVASSVIQPAFYTSKPTAGTADPTDIALILKSGAYAQVPVSTLGGSATQAQIWSTRLRSFNAIGNPNFEVDQRNVGASAGMYSATNTLQIDRWLSLKATAATMTGNMQQVSASPPVLLPGTSFALSSKFWRFTLLTSQVSLAAGDYHALLQYVEGPQWRELSNDVHSVSLLVRSSVAGLNFGVLLKDPATTTKTLSKLCNIPTANTWTLITLPNLPVWPSGNFVTTPGANGYQFLISLSCSASLLNPANDTWQNGAFFGALGQNNFAASPVNSTFDIAFVQHEPGAVCSTLMDKPFTQNLDECQRYYSKSPSYSALATTPNNALGAVTLVVPASQSPYGYVPYKKTMAKVASYAVYSPITGLINNVRDLTSNVDRVVSGAVNGGDSGFGGVTLSTVNSATAIYEFHYTADAGW